MPLEILGTSSETCSKFHTQDLQIFGPTEQNLMVAVTWRPEFVQLCVRLCQSSKNVQPLVPYKALVSKISSLMLYHKINNPIQTYGPIQHKTGVCSAKFRPTMFKILDHPVLGHESP